MNTPPPHLLADRLWRELAKAQDTALERDPLPAPRVPGARACASVPSVSR